MCEQEGLPRLSGKGMRLGLEMTHTPDSFVASILRTQRTRYFIMESLGVSGSDFTYQLLRSGSHSLMFLMPNLPTGSRPPPSWKSRLPTRFRALSRICTQDVDFSLSSHLGGLGDALPRDLFQSPSFPDTFVSHLRLIR